MLKRIVLVTLFAASFVVACSATPQPAPTLIAPPHATQSATTEKVTLQKPVFIEFYSTL